MFDDSMSVQDADDLAARMRQSIRSTLLSMPNRRRQHIQH